MVVDGEVIEADPPRKLVQTWRMLMDPEHGGRRLHAPDVGDRAEGEGGVTRLTVTHELEGAPKMAALVAGEHRTPGAGGGWGCILSDLKTLLETGKSMEWQPGSSQG